MLATTTVVVGSRAEWSIFAKEEARSLEGQKHDIRHPDTAFRNRAALLLALLLNMAMGNEVWVALSSFFFWPLFPSIASWYIYSGRTFDALDGFRQNSQACPHGHAIAIKEPPR